MASSGSWESTLGLPDIEDWIQAQKFETTADVKIPPQLVDQVIGQEHAVEVIKKAAIQRRHVMMIGSPGTGKSMLAKAMADLATLGDRLGGAEGALMRAVTAAFIQGLARDDRDAVERNLSVIQSHAGTPKKKDAF